MFQVSFCLRDLVTGNGKGQDELHLAAVAVELVPLAQAFTVRIYSRVPGPSAGRQGDQVQRGNFNDGLSVIVAYNCRQQTRQNLAMTCPDWRMQDMRVALDTIGFCMFLAGQRSR